jgi:mannose-6-phosphate isomerase-like protein (cupin superfamily)
MLEPGSVVRSPRGTVVEILESSPERFRLRRTLPPHTGRTPSHRHTNGVERFLVIEGEVIGVAAGVIRALTAGDALDVPLGAPHVHPHTGPTATAVVEQTIEPRPRFVEVFFASWLTQLAQGRVDSQDEPKLLAVLSVIRHGGGGTWVVGPPAGAQKALAAALAPLAAARGYGAVI